MNIPNWAIPVAQATSWAAITGLNTKKSACPKSHMERYMSRPRDCFWFFFVSQYIIKQYHVNIQTPGLYSRRGRMLIRLFLKITSKMAFCVCNTMTIKNNKLLGKVIFTLSPNIAPKSNSEVSHTQLTGFFFFKRKTFFGAQMEWNQINKKKPHKYFRKKNLLPSVYCGNPMCQVTEQNRPTQELRKTWRFLQEYANFPAPHTHTHIYIYIYLIYTYLVHNIHVHSSENTPPPQIKSQGGTKFYYPPKSKVRGSSPLKKTPRFHHCV